MEINSKQSIINIILALLGQAPLKHGEWWSMCKELLQKQNCNTPLQFVMVVYIETNTITLWILSYKCFAMQKYSASCTDFPYYASMVNHAMNNEMAKIAVATHQVGMINYATKNDMEKIMVLHISLAW